LGEDFAAGAGAVGLSAVAGGFLLERAAGSGRDEVLTGGRFLFSGMRHTIITSLAASDQLDQSTPLTVALRRTHGSREEPKNRRSEEDPRDKQTGWRHRAGRTPTTRAPPRASRVRKSKNCKYKQHLIPCCSYLQFFDFLYAGRRPAAADRTRQLRFFVSSFLANYRRCVSAGQVNRASIRHCNAFNATIL
jgi:hypothetical protein